MIFPSDPNRHEAIINNTQHKQTNCNSFQDLLDTLFLESPLEVVYQFQISLIFEHISVVRHSSAL